MTNDQVDDAFQALHGAQRQATLLYMDQRDANDDVGAARTKLRMDSLQNDIDALINKELTDWQAGAEALIPQLQTLANNAQSAVSAVEADVKNAQKIVDAMEALDQVIAVAVKLIG